MRILFRQHVLAGMVFVLAGLLFLIVGFRYPSGAMSNVGPGFWPRILSLGLIGIGLVAFVQGLADFGEATGRIRLRPVLVLVAAMVFFAMTIRPLGLAPAVFGTVLVGGLAARGQDWRIVILSAVILAVACSLIFVVALNLPISTFGPVLRRLGF